MMSKQNPASPEKQAEEFLKTGFEVPVRKIPETMLLLQQALGDGTIGGCKVSVTSVIPTGSIIVNFDGLENRFIVNVRDVVIAAYEAFKKEKDERGKRIQAQEKA